MANQDTIDYKKVEEFELCVHRALVQAVEGADGKTVKEIIQEAVNAVKVSEIEAGSVDLAAALIGKAVYQWKASGELKTVLMNNRESALNNVDNLCKEWHWLKRADKLKYGFVPSTKRAARIICDDIDREIDPNEIPVEGMMQYGGLQAALKRVESGELRRKETEQSIKTRCVSAIKSVWRFLFCADPRIEE